VWLGREDQLVPAAQDNPRGFFEHAELKQLNVELLQCLGRKSDRPQLPFPQNWLFRDELKPLMTRAKTVIARDLAYEPCWGFKDPRICLTLPFWLEVLPTARVILVYRDPLEVAISLWVRGRYPLQWGFHLWAAYHLCFAENASRAHGVLAVSYARLVKAPRLVLGRVASFLGLAQDQVETASEFITSELYRNRRRAHRWPDGVPKSVFRAAQCCLWLSALTGKSLPLRVLPGLLKAWAYERPGLVKAN
jgi:hypothetical protein